MPLDAARRGRERRPRARPDGTPRARCRSRCLPQIHISGDATGPASSVGCSRTFQFVQHTSGQRNRSTEIRDTHRLSTDGTCTAHTEDPENDTALTARPHSSHRRLLHTRTGERLPAQVSEGTALPSLSRHTSKTKLGQRAACRTLYPRCHACPPHEVRPWDPSLHSATCRCHSAEPAWQPTAPSTTPSVSPLPWGRADGMASPTLYPTMRR